MNRNVPFVIALIFVSQALALVADAQLRREIKKHDVGVDEHVGAILPMDAEFRKEDGNTYKLEYFFKSDRPILLTMNYSDCPMLCNLQLTKLISALREMEIQPGRDFDLISVSIDPNEGPIRARQTKEKYITIYGKEKSEQAWHFLTGGKNEIDRLATAVGFRYDYVLSTKEYVHPPVFMLCSADGKVLRYVHGVDFDPNELQAAIVETGEGKEGNSISRFLFSCFLDRGYSGQYSLSVMKTMRMAGGATVLILFCALVPYWLTRNTATTKVATDSTESEKSTN